MRTTCLVAFGLALTVTEAAAGAMAWVSNERDNTLSVIDVAALKVVDTIPVGQRPRGYR
jgi:YVTN family beta-propeller protein